MRIPFAVFLALLLLAPSRAFCAEERAPRFKSGQYEQLMLAVDAAGRVTGYYREGQGQGVEKICAFFLAGQVTGGEIPITVWCDGPMPGLLKPLQNGVRLTIPHAPDLPGCGLVLLPQIAQGLDLDRVAEAAWSELRRISRSRARLHASPDPARVLRSYLVQGDICGVLAKEGSWLKIEYQGGRAPTVGWILASDSAALVPPTTAQKRSPSAAPKPVH